MSYSMVSRRRGPALAIAVIALISALGAVSYAATKLPKNSVGARQIKADAVTGQKVADGSLGSSDFAAGQLGAGPRGAQGPPGDPALGPGRGVFRDAEVTITAVDPAAPTPVATMTGLPTGTWAINAKTVIGHTGGTAVTCRLLAPATGGGDVDTVRVLNGGVEHTLAMQVLHTVPVGGQDVRVACSKSNGFAVDASFTKIQAVRLTSATNVAVGG